MLPAGEPVSGCPLTLLPGTSAHEEVQPRSARRLLCRGRQLGQGSGRCPARLAPHCLVGRRRCCLYRGVRGARSAVPDPAQECRALYFARRPPDRLRAAAEAARCRDDLGRPRTHPILPRSICDRPRRVRHRRARSDEHTCELQSLMRISYAVLCLLTTTLSFNYAHASSAKTTWSKP